MTISLPPRLDQSNFGREVVCDRRECPDAKAHCARTDSYSHRTCTLWRGVECYLRIPTEQAWIIRWRERHQRRAEQVAVRIELLDRHVATSVESIHPERETEARVARDCVEIDFIGAEVGFTNEGKLNAGR